MAETIQVVFGLSAAYSIRQALQLIGCQERVLGCVDDLSFGPIDGSDAAARETWIANELGLDFEKVCREAALFWAEATSPDVSVVAWVCRNQAREYAGFFEFVRRMADRPFRVVDATDARLASRQAWRVWSLDVLTPVQIIEAKLFESQRTVSEEQRARYRDQWRQLRSENAPFRIVDATGLASAPITYFDEMILGCLPSTWERADRVVGEAMVKLIEQPLPQSPGDLVIWSRMRTLGEAGKIEIRGPGPDMRNHEVRQATRRD